ncbi:MAG: four helix bundle protein [Bacteroidetes bacterium]|nr:four helix bundle protein [Bacteroidota bacterium]
MNTTPNSTYPKGGVSCSKDSFEVNQTVVFQIKFCNKSPALRVAAKRYLKISTGSCAEVRSMLILSRELGFCSQTEIEEGYKTSIEISQNLSNFIKYLSSKIKDKFLFRLDFFNL